MSSALLWIFLPIGVGVALLLLRRGGTGALIIAMALSLLLAWVAWQVPIDQPLSPFTFRIAPTLNLFGRSFTLGDAQRPLLALIYLALALWLGGAYLAQPGRLFQPVALVIVGLLVAALSVQPFLYAALLIVVAALISVPLLVPPGKRAGRGVLRFLSFQLFALPFILFTGWILTGVEASPGNLDLVLRAGVLLALGFVFMLGIIPFHS